MNDLGDIGGTGTGIGVSAAIWALVKVLKKDRVAEALEAVTRELHELRTQVAVLLDRDAQRQKQFDDLKEEVREIRDTQRQRHVSGSHPAYVPQENR